jgi:outer membrane lipoprotein-sorting protein
MKRYLLALAALTLVCVVGAAQNIVTADNYFDSVSQTYAGVRDYAGAIEITSGQTKMVGTIKYKTPELLRIDFTDPAGQLILFNRQELIVYLPDQKAVLRQAVGSSGSVAGAPGGAAALNSQSGLKLLRTNYSMAYDKGPTPVPLEDGSKEMVVKLRLKQRGSQAGFDKLTISINPDTKLIRRIEGTNDSGIFTRFDFINLRVNVDLSDNDFSFPIPGSAKVYENFLFKD